LILYSRDRLTERRAVVDNASVDSDVLERTRSGTRLSFEAVLVAPSVDCVNNTVFGTLNVIPGRARLPPGVYELGALIADFYGRPTIPRTLHLTHEQQECRDATLTAEHPLFDVCARLRAVAPPGQVGCLAVNGTHTFQGRLPFETLVIAGFATSNPYGRNDPRIETMVFGQGIHVSVSTASWKEGTAATSSLTRLNGPGKQVLGSPQRRYAIEATVNAVAHYAADGTLAGVGHQIGMDELTTPIQFDGGDEEPKFTAIEIVLRSDGSVMEIREETVIGVLALLTELIAFSSFVTSVVAFLYRIANHVAEKRAAGKSSQDKNGNELAVALNSDIDATDEMRQSTTSSYRGSLEMSPAVQLRTTSSVRPGS
jgi:hypothetical protein